jgi:cyclic pyranopterin phosphate synthase
VIDGIDAACAMGFSSVKLDTVVIAGINDHEMPTLLEFARAKGAELRFIEYMDVGGATQWSPARVVTRRQILDRLTLRFGPIDVLPKTDAAPADRFRLADGTTFGIVSSMSRPFCGTCDRARLTADGMWFTCLYALGGHDLGTLLRSGADDELLLARIRAIWSERTDRGAEERAASADRRPLAQRDHLRSTPHLEMHRRGG